MNSEQFHTAYRNRMLSRIRTVETDTQAILPRIEDLFASTHQLRSTVEAQRDDARNWALNLEGGTEQEEALAVELYDYSVALDEALNPQRPAPHFQGVRSALEQRLDPAQIEEVTNSESMQQAADASLENALYSGRELMASGRSQDRPFIYRHHKQDWDVECLAGVNEGRYIGYRHMSPIKEQVRETMSPKQRIEHDQREIDATMIGHTPLGAQMGLDPLEQHAADYYGAPMISPTPAQTNKHIATTMTALAVADTRIGPDLS